LPPSSVFRSQRFKESFLLFERNTEIREENYLFLSDFDTFEFKMTASIFVGGKPIDGKLILSDDWRKVRDMKLCLSVLPFPVVFVRSSEEARQPGRAFANSSRNFFLLFFFFALGFPADKTRPRERPARGHRHPPSQLLYKITKLLLL